MSDIEIRALIKKVRSKKDLTSKQETEALSLRDEIAEDLAHYFKSKAFIAALKAKKEDDISAPGAQYILNMASLADLFDAYFIPVESPFFADVLEFHLIDKKHQEDERNEGMNENKAA